MFGKRVEAGLPGADQAVGSIGSRNGKLSALILGRVDVLVFYGQSDLQCGTYFGHDLLIQTANSGQDSFLNINGSYLMAKGNAVLRQVAGAFVNEDMIGPQFPDIRRVCQGNDDRCGQVSIADVVLDNDRRPGLLLLMTGNLFGAYRNPNNVTPLVE